MDYAKILRAANIARQKEYLEGTQISELGAAFRAAELAGEAGELISNLQDMDEVADNIICLDLAAMEVGLDLVIYHVPELYPPSVKDYVSAALRACSQLKKYERDGLGLPGSKPDKNMLLQHLQTAMSTLIVTACDFHKCSLDEMMLHVSRKFNDDSRKLDYTTLLDFGPSLPESTIGNRLRALADGLTEDDPLRMTIEGVLDECEGKPDQTAIADDLVVALIDRIDQMDASLKHAEAAMLMSALAVETLSGVPLPKRLRKAARKLGV